MIIWIVRDQVSFLAPEFLRAVGLKMDAANTCIRGTPLIGTDGTVSHNRVLLAKRSQRSRTHVALIR
jgi:hypothetical protein